MARTLRGASGAPEVAGRDQLAPGLRRGLGDRLGLPGGRVRGGERLRRRLGFRGRRRAVGRADPRALRNLGGLREGDGHGAHNQVGGPRGPGGERGGEGHGGDGCAARRAERRVGRAARQQVDPLGEGMDRLGRPVAAQRQGPGGELGLQHRLGIGPPRAGVGGHHLGVASQLLVDPQVVGQQMDQRVEPVHTAHQGHQGVGAAVVAGDVGLFVGQHDQLLARGVALVEVVGRLDPRAQDADHRRPRAAVTQRSPELDLPPGQPDQAGQAARQPDRRQRGAQARTGSWVSAK